MPPTQDVSRSRALGKLACRVAAVATLGGLLLLLGSDPPGQSAFVDVLGEAHRRGLPVEAVVRERRIPSRSWEVGWLLWSWRKSTQTLLARRVRMLAEGSRRAGASPKERGARGGSKGGGGVPSP